MLLSEEAYEKIVSSYPPKSDSEDIQLLQDVIKLFYDKFRLDINNSTHKTVGEAKVIYQRLCITWDSISERLEKENKCYLKKGGFKALLESKPEFDSITK